MSSGKEWLGKMKKGELSDLAEHLKLSEYAKAKKNELEIMIEDFLNNNQSKLSKDTQVAPFYGDIGSPEAAAKKPRRRQTLKAKESDALTTTTSSTSPTTPSRLKSLIPTLPASPKDVANSIESTTRNLSTTLRTTISNTGFSVPTALHPTSIRSTASSATSIHLLILALEAFYLRSALLPLRYLTTLPAIPALGITFETPIKIPDLFALLTVAFWGPFGLWVATSIALPLVGAWFVNLQQSSPQVGGKGRGAAGGREYDAVSFGIVKALVAWVVYVQGGVGGESTGVVEGGVPGGAVGLIVGGLVGGGAGLYEAVLRK